MARLLQFANNAVSKLSGNISAGDTTFSVLSGDGAKFPALSAGKYFMATLVKVDGSAEIVKVTGRSGDIFTATRAAEPVGTTQTALSFSAGDRVELRLTGAALAAELDRLAQQGAPSVQNKSTNYTVTANDIGDLIRVDTTATDRVITLPLLSSLTDDFEIIIAKATGDTHKVTINPAGSNTINGAGVFNLVSQFQSAWLVADRASGTWTAVMSGGASSIVVVDAFTGDGTANPLTLSGDPGTKNNTTLIIGGVPQMKASYTLTGTSIAPGAAIPSGVAIEVWWFSSSSVATVNTSSLTFHATGTGAVPRTIEGKLQEVVSVKDFGATGDGTTDDTAAIQAAADAAAGRILYFPAVSASYKISTAINLSNSTTVVGDGRGSVVKLASGNITGFDSNAKSSVIVRDLVIYSPNAGTTAYIGGVRFYGSTKCKVLNVEFIGMSWAGVLLNNAADCLVEGCRFSGVLGSIQDSADVCIYRDSVFNIVRGNFCYGGGDHGVFMQDPYLNTMPTGNTITGNQVSGQKAYGIAIYVTSYYNTQTVISNNNIHNIIGSSVSGASGAGIYIQSAGGTTITGNTIRNCCIATTNFGTLSPAAIGITNLLSGTPPVVVADNIIAEMTRGPGIYVNTTDVGVVIKGNIVEITNSTSGYFGDCIRMSNVRRPLISDNRLTQGRTDSYAVNIIAVDTYTMEATTLRGNQIKSSGYGIGFNRTGTGSYVRSIISGNNVETADQGLNLIGATDTVIDGNVLYSSGTYPFILSNSPKTRITNTKMIAGTAGFGPLFSGTNTGSFMDRSCEWSKIMTSNAGNGVLIEQFGTAAPMGSGSWNVGDAVIQSVPVVGSPKRWRCTAAGNPGTWVSEGNL